MNWYISGKSPPMHESYKLPSFRSTSYSFVYAKYMHIRLDDTYIRTKHVHIHEEHHNLL